MCAWGFQGSPSITTVEPESGKAGTAVTAKGTNLASAAVAELYLTDGKNDTKVTIASQTAEEIKFTVPKMAPGAYHLMVLTGNRASMLEEPVVFTVTE